MSKRLFSTIFLWGVVAGVFYVRQLWAIAALVIVLAILGSVEFIRITKTSPGDSRRKGAFIVSILYMAFLAWDLLANSGTGDQARVDKLLSFSPEMVGLLVTLFLAFFMSLRNKINGTDSINAVGLSILGYIYVPVLFGGFMMRLIFLPPSPEVSGAWLILFVSIVTKFTDMGAYLMGTLFGKHKMIKHISPGKTWEGTLGSFLVAQLGAFAVWYFAGEDLAWMGEWWNIMILGTIISIAAIIGDLAESILKRSLEVKDSGDTLPGIGGVLDLIDSICFAAPAAYLYLVFTTL